MGILGDIATAVGSGFIQNSANNDAMYSEAFGFEPQPQLQEMSQAITTDLENKVEKARQQREIAAKQEAEKKRQQEEWNNSVLGKAEHWDNLEKATPWGNVTSYEIQQKAAEKIGENAINSTVNYFKGAKAGYLAYADARNNFDKVAEYDAATGRYAPKEGYTQNDVDFAEEQVKKAGSAFRNETLYPGAMVLGVLGAPFTGGGSLALSGAAGLFSLGENVNSSMEEAAKRGETPLEIAGEGVRTATYGPLADTLTDPDLMKKLGDKPLSTFGDIAFSGMQAVAPLAMARAGVRSIKIPKEVLSKTPGEILAAADTYDKPPDEISQPAPKSPVGADVEDYEGVKPVGKEGANAFGPVLYDDYGIDAEITSGKRSVENNRAVGGAEAERSAAETPVEGKNEGTIINTPQPDTEGLEYAKPSESKNVDESVPDKEVIEASGTPRWNHSEKDTMQFNQEESVVDKPPVKITSITGTDIPLSNDFKKARKDTLTWAKQNIRGSYENLDTGWDISVGGRGLEHTISTAKNFEQLRSIVAIPELIREAVKIDSRDNLPANEHIKAVHTFYAPFQIADKTFISKIVAKETMDGHILYDHQASKIEKPDVVVGATSENKSLSNAPPSGSTMNIRDLLQYVKAEHKPPSLRGSRTTAGRYHRGALSTPFSEGVHKVVGEYGLTPGDFDSLRRLSAEELTTEQRKTMRTIRDSIPPPTQETLLQKVIPEEDIAKYLEGDRETIKGFITRAQDVSMLDRYEALYRELRLDYPDSKYNPKANRTMGIIRFKTGDSDRAEVAYSPTMGGTVTDEPPFLGTGFTAARKKGLAIPEYKLKDKVTPLEGAELFEINKEGVETLLARYNESKHRFIPIKGGETK